MQAACPNRHLAAWTVRKAGQAWLFVMLFTLVAAWPSLSVAQAGLAVARGWGPGTASGSQDAPGKLAAFMSRWSFKLSHQMAEPAHESRLLSSNPEPTGGTSMAPAQVQWHVSAQAAGNDGKALVRSLGAVNGGDVELFASVSRFWLGSEVGSRFMATAAARLARDDTASWHAPYVQPYAQQERSRRLQLEGGLGWLVRDDVVAGATYRVKSPATEKRQWAARSTDEAWDVFVAWLPWWGGAVTMAWVNMASEPSQTRWGGVFLSGQIAY